MTVHVTPPDTAPDFDDGRATRHDIIDLRSARLARHLVLFPPMPADLERLLDETRVALPGVADVSVVRRVMTANPDTVFAIARRERYDALYRLYRELYPATRDIAHALTRLQRG